MVVTFENAASIMVTPNLLNAGEMISVNIAGNNQSKFDVKLFDMSGECKQSVRSKIFPGNGSIILTEVRYRF